MKRRWLAALSFVAAPLACNALLGAGEPVPTGSGGASASTGSAGEAGASSVGSSSSSTATSSSAAGGGGSAGGSPCKDGELCVLVGGGKAVKKTPDDCDNTPYLYVHCNSVHCACPHAFDPGDACRPAAVPGCDSDAGVEIDEAGCVNLGSSAASISVNVGANFGCGPPEDAGAFNADSPHLCDLHDLVPCGNGGVCLPDIGCVVVADGLSCPPNLVARTEVAIDNSETDHVCNCTCTGCEDRAFDVFSGPDCTGQGQEVRADDECLDLPLAYASLRPNDTMARCIAGARPTSHDHVLCCRHD